MEFYGFKGCESVYEVVKYIYKHKLSESERTDLNLFIKQLFEGIFEHIDSFNIHASYQELSDINGVKFNPYYMQKEGISYKFDSSKLHKLDEYIKNNFDAEGLHICSILYDGNYLTCYTLNKV